MFEFRIVQGCKASSSGFGGGGGVVDARLVAQIRVEVCVAGIN